MDSQDDYTLEDDPLYSNLTREQRQAISALLERARRDQVQAQEELRLERERRQEELRLERERRQEELRLERERRQEELRLEREMFQERLRQQQEETRLAREDAATVSRALEDERAEQAQLDAGHAVDQYVTRGFRLHFHLSRLLPQKITTEKTASDIPSTTTGRTTIKGKYYPLKLVLWDECDSALAQAYGAIRSKLGDQLLFPSARQMVFMENNLLEETPQEFSSSEKYLTELKTSYFLHEVLEKPATRILNAYLSRHKVFIDNKNAGALVRYITRNSTQDQDGESEQTQEQPLGEQVEGQEATPAEAAPPKIPVKVQADCIVLCTRVKPDRQAVGVDHGHVEQGANTEDEGVLEGDVLDGGQEDGAEPDPKVFRIAFGEHKPAHSLRAAVVRAVMENGIKPDYVLQMALLKAVGRPSLDAKKGVLGSASGQVYFTYALTQTYHYMISAGILYGYVASGDTLTFLHIDREDPTTLQYWPVTFPEFAKGFDVMGSERVAELLADTPSLPVARLCSIVLKAWQDGTEDQRWRAAAFSKLAMFPNLPPGVTESSVSSPSHDDQSSPPSSPGHGPKKRGFSDFEDNDDDEDDDNSGGGRRGNPSQHLSVAIANRPRNPSPLRQHNQAMPQQTWNSPMFGLRDPVFLKPSRFDPASFDPIRPYCTQACLLGLTRGLPLDDQCPNVLLHQRAAQHARYGAMTLDDLLPTQPGKMLHAIRSVGELERLLVLQLYGNIMQDCKCLLENGLFGLIGCLYKLTLTGYGYTFVAKGVQMFDQKKLQREAVVYKHLAEQQGRLVPVYLGAVKLLLPYGQNNSVVVTHMMLMSYGGPSSDPDIMTEDGIGQVGVDLRWEADRTWEELQDLGIDDDDTDNMDSNFTWCEEAKRMMRIDFHRARVLRDDVQLRGQTTHEDGKPCTPSSSSSTLVRASSPIPSLAPPLKRLKK